MVLVMSTFQAARSGAPVIANLPSAGTLWWRAQLRRRNAAIESISKPIFGAQIFALAIAVVVAVGVVLSEAGNWLRLASWFKELPHIFDLSSLLSASLPHPDGTLWLLLPVLATVALVSGVVVYFASEKQ